MNQNTIILTGSIAIAMMFIIAIIITRSYGLRFKMVEAKARIRR